MGQATPCTVTSSNSCTDDGDDGNQIHQGCMWEITATSTPKSTHERGLLALRMKRGTAGRVLISLVQDTGATSSNRCRDDECRPRLTVTLPNDLPHAVIGNKTLQVTSYPVTRQSNEVEIIVPIELYNEYGDLAGKLTVRYAIGRHTRYIQSLSTDLSGTA